MPKIEPRSSASSIIRASPLLSPSSTTTSSTFSLGIKIPYETAFAGGDKTGSIVQPNSPPPNNKNRTFVIVGVVLGLVLTVTLVTCFWAIWRRRQLIRSRAGAGGPWKNKMYSNKPTSTLAQGKKLKLEPHPPATTEKPSRHRFIEIRKQFPRRPSLFEKKPSLQHVGLEIGRTIELQHMSAPQLSTQAHAIDGHGVYEHGYMYEPETHVRSASSNSFTQFRANSEFFDKIRARQQRSYSDIPPAIETSHALVLKAKAASVPPSAADSSETLTVLNEAPGFGGQTLDRRASPLLTVDYPGKFGNLEYYESSIHSDYDEGTVERLHHRFGDEEFSSYHTRVQDSCEQRVEALSKWTTDDAAAQVSPANMTNIEADVSEGEGEAEPRAFKEELVMQDAVQYDNGEVEFENECPDSNAQVKNCTCATKALVESSDVSDSDLPWKGICVLGVSKSMAHLRQMQDLWSRESPSFWFLWNDTFTGSDETVLINVYPVEKLIDHKDPLISLLKRARKLYVCEYFLTIDGDFSFKSTSEDSLHSVLTDTLWKYRPVVATFAGSEKAKKSQKYMDELEKSAEGHKDVINLRGFDSRIAIYHNSVVEFFIRQALHYQEHSSRSYSSQFANLFAPLLFRGEAIQINSIVWKDVYSLKQSRENKENSVIHLLGPNQHLENQRFRDYIQSGLWQLESHIGPGLRTFDVSWPIETFSSVFNATDPQSWSAKRLNNTEILDRLWNLYDINHPALKKNVWLHSQMRSGLLQQWYGQKIAKGEDVKFSIHIFAAQRTTSFDRLWLSLNNAFKISSQVEITIHIDFCASSNALSTFMKGLRSLRSPHGPVSVSVATDRRNMPRDVISSWYPKDRREFGIMLEDGVVVSKHMLEYAQQVARSILAQDIGNNVLGSSLYNLRHDEVNDRPWRPIKTLQPEPYLLQVNHNFGIMFAPQGWTEFVNWYMRLPKWVNPLIPQSKTNLKPPKRWDKFLLRFMAHKGKTVLYPNLPGGLSLAKPIKSPAISDGTVFPTSLLDFSKIRNSTALIKEKHLAFYKSISVNSHLRHLSLISFNDSAIELFLKSSSTNKQSLWIGSSAWLNFRKLESYDTYFNPISKGLATALGMKVKSFDRCTLILQVYSRTNTILKRLRFYENLPLLDSILVVWNNMNVSPPTIAHSKSTKKLKSKTPEFSIPIYFLQQSKNSINNRYKPFPELKTDCVISMDDDWDMPHAHLVQAIKLWQGQYYDNLVGFHHQGRLHMPGETPGTWIYSRESKNAVSILLPSGTVYHRKYHDMYTNQLPAMAREKVDELMNCEDILINLMVSNATQMGPIVLELWAKSIDMGGLWQDPTHFRERDDCLNYFVTNVFGGVMPLKYTTQFFKPSDWNGTLRTITNIKFSSELEPRLRKT
ncbi:Exostoses (Multiple)-like 3 [Blyttiomyces sp. JEL0837]|nr:Exostoses (Multiple)-like 3 [Blyttiomyces sp. JEL0837]